MVKHDKTETRSFKNVESRRCPHCGKISHNAGPCSECREKLYCRSCTHLLSEHAGTPIQKVGNPADFFPECTNCTKCST